jgi:hypothetical protein
MALILNGTDGLSDVDGSAATPAIRGTDTNTGIFFPAADTIAFSEGGAEVMRIDSSGNLGFTGTAQRITGDFTNATVASRLAFQSSTTNGNTSVAAIPNGTSVQANIRAFANSDPTNASFIDIGADPTAGSFLRADRTGTGTYLPLTMYTGGSERLRIDTSGNLLVGTTSGFASERFRSNGSGFSPAASFTFSSTLGATSQNLLFFGSAHGLSGALLANNTAVSLANASDYRLKTNINPLIGGLNQVLSLKPKEFEWLNSNDNIKTQGFIAHEVQEVLPVAVFGEKDAVNEDGTIKSQMMDATKFIPIIISAIQELKAELDTVKSELATLKGAA